MTHPSIQDVEEAVRWVLGGRNGAAKPGRAEPEIFTGRLFSLRHAEARSRQSRVVQVVSGTVVTPLARDFLKREGIELRFVSRAEGGSGGDVGQWAFAIEVESGLMDTLRRALLDSAAPWIELDPTSKAAATWVSEAPTRGSFLLTEDASVAVWRACRFPNVRPAAAHDVDGVNRAIRALGLNLLVVEPRGKSISELKEMGAAFRRGRAPRISDALRGENEP
jgi:hypothetical protein